MEMAMSMAHALEVVLMDRVPRVVARAFAPTSSTPGRPWRKRRIEPGLESGRLSADSRASVTRLL
jgi:hypothetical protein